MEYSVTSLKWLSMEQFLVTRAMYLLLKHFTLTQYKMTISADP